MKIIHVFQSDKNFVIISIIVDEVCVDRQMFLTIIIESTIQR